MTLSIPNASRNNLFDAQPRKSDAAPSIVIQPSVMYVSSSASRTASAREAVMDVVSSRTKVPFVIKLLDVSHVQITGTQISFAVIEKLCCPCGTIERNFGVPIAGHVDLNFRAAARHEA